MYAGKLPEWAKQDVEDGHCVVFGKQMEGFSIAAEEQRNEGELELDLD